MRFLASAFTALGIATAPAQATITLTPELGTEFRTYVTDENIASVDVDADIAVSAALPDTVVVQPVPEVIVTKAPEFEGYRYAVVGGRIVVIEPSTTNVVPVVD